MLSVFSDRCKRAFNDRSTLAGVAKMPVGRGVKGLDFTYKIVGPTLDRSVEFAEQSFSTRIDPES